MKKNIYFINIKKNKFTISVICFIILVTIFYFILRYYLKNNDNDIVSYDIKTNTNMTQKNIENNNVVEIKDTLVPMIEEFKGFKTLGKIVIPKIKLDSYILEKCDERSLNTSVAKLLGPEINTQGNFCIAGHNFKMKNMFGDLNKLSVGDIIYLYDKNNNKIEYVIYDIFTANADDTSCLEYNYNNNKEVTLITCTTAAIKRLIIKAKNVYEG